MFGSTETVKSILKLDFDELQKIQLNKYNCAIDMYKKINKGQEPPQETKDQWARKFNVTHLLRKK
jgi:hypothetical protein